MRQVVRIAVAALTLAAVAIPVGAQQSGAAAPGKKDSSAPEPLPRRGFNVVLLVGDMMGPGYPKPIPEAALRALSDMRDFLPYKGYNLLDTQWIVGGTSSPAVTRLRGLDDQDYELELRASPTLQPGTAAPDRTGMSVRFVLRDVDTSYGSGEKGRTPLPKEAGKSDPAAAEIAREIFQLERERADLQIQVEHKRRNVEVGVGDPVEVQRQQTQLTAVTQRIQSLKQESAAAAAVAKVSGRAVIDTSFRMDDGETVVVGTSKMKGGGKALIALLTATSDRPKGSTK